MADCLFCRISARQIPAQIVYEDELCIAFKDIHPAAEIHILFVPKEHLVNALDIDEQREKLMGHLVRVAADVARELGVAEKGFRLVMNNNAGAGQVIFHLHLHLLAGDLTDRMA